MRYVEVSGVLVSAIGLGTWQFGSWEWGYGDAYAQEEALAIVRRALDLGITLIDTAEIYAFGRSERIVARRSRGVGTRRSLRPRSSRCCPSPSSSSTARARARPGSGSTRSTSTKCIGRNPLVAIGTTMEGMRRLQRAGLIRHVGVSNFSAAQWQAAEHALGAPVVSNQVEYSLVARRAEHTVLAYARQAGRLVIAYSPLAQGILSARYDEHRAAPAGCRRGSSDQEA
jgi:aryl-alcohol dehydrogenase-like predicted oxidoreductase